MHLQLFFNDDVAPARQIELQNLGIEIHAVLARYSTGDLTDLADFSTVLISLAGNLAGHVTREMTDDLVNEFVKVALTQYCENIDFARAC